MEENTSTEARREYVRTNDLIPVYYEVLRGDEESRSILDWELLFDDIEPKPEENPKLYELLFDINQKLNILLNEISEKNGFNLPVAREVNISGGGLRFIAKDRFEAGARLMLKTFLPTYAHVIRLTCEVVRCEPAVGGYEVAVMYAGLDETTRDKIIKYIFARQRKLLRTEKGKPE
ncbi:MAG TPA: hypothetical protein DDW94_04200 [Deltaproteobacteria bacterium]|nr:MAG: hypothetical protein A2Z79_10580 [Deltaproteobacteria bacterium GWA2_55_82]OGQ62929.1 MAG: hypothetical protein A3I81_06390 [Deltaproteobacteria bacterium RIFCSPLOWO2_02_FULL_55_12]OIJ72891.1 MAG: hypothetical protein A2V21_300625 [Deltaproteobacteria bacterium GWC2_55_46]HBG46174.1 hypothetical protein [Deltaproteobacteria bacterium]HCY11672.1 hypothetical protein [Deltaproteobacteria bacterium]